MAKQSVNCAVIIALREEFLGNKGMNGIENISKLTPSPAQNVFGGHHIYPEKALANNLGHTQA
jgi:hypothetical protein